MSGLPEGWALTSIGDVTGKADQRIPEATETFIYLDIGSISRDAKEVVSPAEILGKNAPSRARQVVKTDDVLVSMTRPNLNAVAMVPRALNDAIASTGFDVLRSTGVESRWIFSAVRSPDFVQAMSELVQGALYPAVRPRDIRGHEIPLPPLAEQKRIADKLDALLARVDAARARLDRVPALLKRFRQSVLAAATSGELTEDWRELARFSRDGGNDVWEEVKLLDVAENLSYGSSAKSEKSGKVPVLRMGNIQGGKLDWNDLVFTSNSDEIEKYRLEAGDFLFNRTNSPELVGKTAVFDGGREAIHAGYLIRVRCSRRLLPEFLNYWFCSKYGRDWCWQVKTDGVSQSNINAKKLAAFRFRLPGNEEQAEIVRRVEALFTLADKVQAQYTAARARIDRLTPALLAKAFRGELVPQDPDDEPASVLLDRIRAERAAAPEPARRGRRTAKAASA